MERPRIDPPPPKRQRFSPDAEPANVLKSVPEHSATRGKENCPGAASSQLPHESNQLQLPDTKRRFFEDAVAMPPIPPPQPPPQRMSSPAAFRENTLPSATSPSATRAILPSPRVAQSSPPRPTNQASAPSSTETFDRNTFEAIVGHKVGDDVAYVISEATKNDMERAVNMYFDGTYKIRLKARQHSIRLVAKVAGEGRAGPMSGRPKDEPRFQPVATSKAEAAINAEACVKTEGSKPQSTKIAPDLRYVGAFGTEGWSTRSGTNLIKHGDIVHIERQKIELPTIRGSKQKTLKLGAAVTVRANSAAAKRVDNIVRFTSTRGFEIGRLSKDAASWVATLMDHNICHFEGTCVFAPERLRTNETVFLQIRCFIKRSAFEEKPIAPADNRTTGLFEEKETREERDLRLRQVSIVKLFQEINLFPTRANAASAKRGREDLLEAADLSEKKANETREAMKNPLKEPLSSQALGPEEPEDGQELEQDQLDALYRKAQSFDFETPEAEPPKTFTLTLRRYQKQALYWMLAKEKNEEAREESMHPLWEEYAWPLKDADDKDLPQIEGQERFYVNPYSGDMSLFFPMQDQRCLGGILADEMGLGKTIQMLSLIHSHKSAISIDVRKRIQAQSDSNTAVQPDGSFDIKPSAEALATLRRIRSPLPNVKHAPCTTLVIAPMSLLAQWQSEAEKASVDGSLRSLVYYGGDKSSDLQRMCSPERAASAPDIIITSYGVVLSEFNQMWNKGPNEGHPGQGLFSLNFFRIILDEAHTIKNRQSKTSKACYALQADHRWALTGTPVVNRLEDLFSLVRFLRVEPWNNFSFWRTFITVPFESRDFMRALDVVQTVLEPLVMRRTKDMKTPDGLPLVPLPPKHIEIIDVELSRAEREVYDYIFRRVRQSFTANIEAGTVMKSYTSIFAQVLRLRQVCCHPVLVRNMDIVSDEVKAGAAADMATGLADDMDLQALVERFTATTDDPTDANKYGAHVLNQIRDEAVNECPICAEEPMEQQTVTGCWHSACKECLIKYIEHEIDNKRVPRCFHCREPINRRDLFEVVRHDDDPSTAGGPPRISLQRVDVAESSSKVVSLIHHLRKLRRARPNIKSVVFSQFTSFMSLIEPALQRSNMDFLRLDGSMSQKARAAVLYEFQESPKFTVLLLSLKAGGVGLNLTMAKRVYMMDPWWSFSVEAQAIDRVHRMGQDEEVKVYRFIVKKSVEEKMLKIQDRKKFIATSLGMMNDEEKKLQRIEDIKDLLS